MLEFGPQTRTFFQTLGDGGPAGEKSNMSRTVVERQHGNRQVIRRLRQQVFAFLALIKNHSVDINSHNNAIPIR